MTSSARGLEEERLSSIERVLSNLRDTLRFLLPVKRRDTGLNLMTVKRLDMKSRDKARVVAAILGIVCAILSIEMDLNDALLHLIKTGNVVAFIENWAGILFIVATGLLWWAFKHRRVNER